MSTAKKFTILFLAFLALKDLSLGASLLLKLQWLLALAKMNYSPDVKITATFFGVCVLIVSSLCMLTINWVIKDKADGVSLAKFIGWWMVIASTIVYLKIDRMDYAAIDFLSGVLILIPAYFVKPDIQVTG